MNRMFRSCIVPLIALLAVSGMSASAERGHAYRAPFDPGLYKTPRKIPASQVAILGSPHFSGFPSSPSAAVIEPVLKKLEAWQPTIIATENLSGLQCDMLRRYPARYASTVDDYCFDPAAAGKAAGLDVQAANTEAERMLADWPAAPGPSARRRLALVFLAAGEPVSATVQWLRLPETERIALDGLTPALVDELNRLAGRKGESYRLGAALAARLSHERVISIDDQSAARQSGDQEAYGAALTKAWDNPATKTRLDAYDKLLAGLGDGDGLLRIYRAYNAPSEALLTYQSDFGAALAEPSQQAYGRRYVGYWETRNLRISGNIRDALTAAPGARAGHYRCVAQGLRRGLSGPDA